MYNYQFKIKEQKGFTLLELLVVIGVLGVLSVIVTSVLVQSLRGELKTQIINRVKQNGQIALDKMVKDIRGADKIICVGDGIDITDTIVVSTIDTKVANGAKIYTKYRFFAPTANANGYIAWENPINPELKDLNGDGILEVCAADIGVNDKLIITDRHDVNGISIRSDPAFPDNIVFRQISSGGDEATIEVKFRAFAAVKSGGLYESTVRNEGIPFSSTIRLRTNLE